MRRLALLLAAFAAALALGAPARAALPPVKHVWTIVLENKGYDETFGPSSPAKFLSKTLPTKGQLLTQYHATGHHSLDNYISMISGQAPTIENQADCPFYHDVLPGLPGPDGQFIGQGCVYPAATKTVADQLAAKSLTWKGYMQDMGTPCRHPALNSQDQTQSGTSPKDQYATKHNPFVYFHSIIDSPSCAANDVDLSKLSGDLTSSARSPSYAMIVPNLCEDGHDTPCADGRPGGLVSIDAFLRRWVPKILASPAYGDNGMLIVTFDEAESGDSSACCGEQSGYNTPAAGGESGGPGGGRTGAVVISRFVKPGTKNDTPYNHYSLLRSIEDLYGLDHLGYAAADGLRPFGSDVFGSGSR